MNSKIDIVEAAKKAAPDRGVRKSVYDKYVTPLERAQLAIAYINGDVTSLQLAKCLHQRAGGKGKFARFSAVATCFSGLKQCIESGILPKLKS